MNEDFSDCPDITEVTDARIALYGRILRCPDGGNPKGCPLHELRQLPIEDRILWLESKSDDEVARLFQHHVRCMAKRHSLQQDEDA